MEVLLRKDRPFTSATQSSWTVVWMTGTAVAVVGWFDLALLWYPLHFGNVEWEFGTISAHLNGMPLGTLGLGLIAAGFVAQRRRDLLHMVAIVAILIALVHLVLAGFYLLDVPVALKASTPQIRQMLEKGMLKAGVYFLAYIAFYAVTGVYLWRIAGATGDDSTPS